jgi:predicted metal-dependent phosphoesterase TrpH
MKGDLHIHTCYSNDGEKSIPEIIRMCTENKVEVFSITDHNGVRACSEAEAGSALVPGLNFIPGIEIDCNYQGTDLHLLGYHIDWSSDEFSKLEKQLEKKYMDAVPEMVANLAREGIHIDMDKLLEKSGDVPPSAELFAEVLLSNTDDHTHPKLWPYMEGGERSDMPLINFYLDYFAQGKPAHVHVEHLPYSVAIELVKSHGGIPVIAHPGLNFRGKEELVEELLDLGAMGLEVFNNYHSAEQTAYFATLVKKWGAWMTCGSDFHGKTKPLISIGQYRLMEEHREYLDQCLEGLLNSRN